jgi:hypothetical protein
MFVVSPEFIQGLVRQYYQACAGENQDYNSSLGSVLTKLISKLQDIGA